MISMLATSNPERRAVFKKFAKAVSEALPDPSAMLFVMLSTAARNCSATARRVAFWDGARDFEEQRRVRCDQDLAGCLPRAAMVRLQSPAQGGIGIVKPEGVGHAPGVA